ncbi:MAG: M6 family metalloprotease domain-containing protein, partial [Bacteroidales bacterium]|nr:M6 family metalloprotease domain-containing protein [Bacteroidales bacterium]
MSKTLLVTILLALSINLFGQADSLCIKTVVIPVQFLDVKFTTENVQDEINALFNGINYSKNGATGSVKEYFRDNLGDAANLEFYVTPVVTALLYKEYYGSNSAVERDLGLSTLVLEACDGARRAGIDFYPFDGDEDENIDHIFLIFAGYNESESGNEKDIMPQSGNLSGYNIKYNQKRVATFSCYSEFSGGSEAEFAHIGTICHEFCHRIGLLDMYDVNGETEGEHPGLMKSTSIMDRGNFNNDGKTPPYFSAIERELMGTLEVEDLVVGQHYELFPTRDAGKALRIATANPGEYFLIEYRDNYKWDRYIGGSGLLIYHIDKSENDVGGITAGERWAINAVNCFASHGCATLFDANNGGTISSVFYPEASNTILSTHTYPITRWNGT